MYQLLAVGDQGCPWMYLCFSSFYLEDVHHSIVYCKHLDSTPVDLRVTDQVSAVLEGQLFHWLIFVWDIKQHQETEDSYIVPRLFNLLSVLNISTRDGLC